MVAGDVADAGEVGSDRCRSALPEDGQDKPSHNEEAVAMFAVAKEDCELQNLALQEQPTIRDPNKCQDEPSYDDEVATMFDVDTEDGFKLQSAELEEFPPMDEIELVVPQNYIHDGISMPRTEWSDCSTTHHQFRRTRSWPSSIRRVGSDRSDGTSSISAGSASALSRCRARSVDAKRLSNLCHDDVGICESPRRQECLSPRYWGTNQLSTNYSADSASLMSEVTSGSCKNRRANSSQAEDIKRRFRLRKQARLQKFQGMNAATVTEILLARSYTVGTDLEIERLPESGLPWQEVHMSSQQMPRVNCSEPLKTDVKQEAHLCLSAHQADCACADTQKLRNGLSISCTSIRGKIHASDDAISNLNTVGNEDVAMEDPYTPSRSSTPIWDPESCFPRTPDGEFHIPDDIRAADSADDDFDSTDAVSNADLELEVKINSPRATPRTHLSRPPGTPPREGFSRLFTPRSMQSPCDPATPRWPYGKECGYHPYEEAWTPRAYEQPWTPRALAKFQSGAGNWSDPARSKLHEECSTNFIVECEDDSSPEETTPYPALDEPEQRSTKSSNLQHAHAMDNELHNVFDRSDLKQHDGHANDERFFQAANSQDDTQDDDATEWTSWTSAVVSLTSPEGKLQDDVLTADNTSRHCFMQLREL